MKRFWGKGTGCRFYTPHDGQHFNFGSTNNFFRHCCPWHKCTWRQISSRRKVYFHPSISSWKGLKLSSKCASCFSLFFFNLSNQFGSYSISDHDDEFNITTKKTRMVHMHTFLNFQLKLLKSWHILGNLDHSFVLISLFSVHPVLFP